MDKQVVERVFTHRAVPTPDPTWCEEQKVVFKFILKMGVDFAEKIKSIVAAGKTFTKEELLFAAMHHDLGKAGWPQENGEIYLPNDSEWHRKNQGKMYKVNPANPFAMVPDLGLWILQNFNIPVTWNEYQAIKIHDGLYDDSNKPYFISRSADSKLRTNMSVILHHADYMAARIEYEAWRENRPSSPTPKKKRQVSSPTPTVNASKLFDDLFGE